MSSLPGNMTQRYSPTDFPLPHIKAEPLVLAPADSDKPLPAKKTKRYSKPRGRCRSPTVVQRVKKIRRVKANDRERNRMHSLNHALDKLRVVLPTSEDQAKFTKIETLRFACEYIEAMKTQLRMADAGLLDYDQSDTIRNSHPDTARHIHSDTVSQRAYGQTVDSGKPNGFQTMDPQMQQNWEAVLEGMVWDSSPDGSSVQSPFDTSSCGEESFHQQNLSFDCGEYPPASVGSDAVPYYLPPFFNSLS